MRQKLDLKNLANPADLADPADLGQTLKTEKNSGMYKYRLNMLSTLKKHFGYDEFRPYQEEIITTLIEDKKDVVAIFATGYGKSLCYQFPAIHTNGLAIIVSPLIALMNDQVQDLKEKKIKVCSLNSSVKNRDQVIQGINTGNYNIVYVTPEYMTSNQSKLKTIHRSVGITLIAIDEAHCVSYMGHSFRPDYRNLKCFKEWFPEVPVIALTATATKEVQEDICNSLGLKNPKIVHSTFDRPNLYLEITKKSSNIVNDIYPLLENKKSTIIYTTTRRDAETISEKLNSRTTCDFYHAGLSNNERDRIQKEFMENKIDIIIATIAFGLGINKPDIRIIINYGCPKNLSSYYQHIGRCSRDGNPGKCYLFYSNKDIATNQYFLKSITDQKFLKYQIRMLAKIETYLYSGECRHKLLIRHFDPEEKVKCKKNCDNCKGNVKEEKKDYNVDAKLLLKAVKKTGGNYGLGYPILILRGSKAKNVKEIYKKMDIYGSGMNHNKQWWNEFGRKLIRKGFLSEEQCSVGFKIGLSEKGREWLNAC